MHKNIDTLTFIKLNSEPELSDKNALVDGLLSYHAAKGHPRKTDVFSIFAHDPSGKPVAGIIVSFLWTGMHIDSLWVAESFRGNGLGTKLMLDTEDEARSRGCVVAYTDTFTWQAPGFYKKLGYSVYGELHDFPEGNSLTYFQKRLG